MTGRRRRRRSKRIVWQVGRGRLKLKGSRLVGLLVVALVVAFTRLFPSTPSTSSEPGPSAPTPSARSPAGQGNSTGSTSSATSAGRANSAAGSYTLAGTVTHITDGDTFVFFSSGHRIRVRLASIDAPETSKNRKRPGQPMGTASKQALARLVAGKSLNLRCFERDHYGRDICDVPLSDGSTANRELVAMGLAWANMQNRGKYMRDPAMPKLQAQAQRKKLGIWQDTKPVPPWVWRYQCWKRGHC